MNYDIRDLYLAVGSWLSRLSYRGIAMPSSISMNLQFTFTTVCWSIDEYLVVSIIDNVSLETDIKIYDWNQDTEGNNPYQFHYNIRNL